MAGSRVAALATSAALLAALDVFLWSTPVDISPLEPAAAISEPRAAPRPVAAARPAPTLDQLAEIAARPLLSASRRPIAVEADAPEIPASEPPDVLVAGVMLSGTERRALLVAGEGAKAEWVAEGSMFAGWQIAAVDVGGVTILNGGARREVALRRASAVRSDATAGGKP